MAHLALVHLRTSRPHNPSFQRDLDRLNDALDTEVRAMGHDVTWHAVCEETTDATRTLVDQADAVVLMGGEDLHPDTYGGPLTYEGSGEHEPLADAAYAAVIHQCLGSRTPLLGICRGIQAVNVALGGTLVQHLAVPDVHRTEAGDTFVAHEVSVLDPTLAQVVGGAVRCGHHQAVATLGAGLEVVARASDGTVEAVRHHTAPLLAVQWHPEHPETAARQVPPLITHLLGLGATTLESNEAS